jgi:hypothetical protein
MPLLQVGDFKHLIVVKGRLEEGWALEKMTAKWE